jgi:hypothetical protein
MTASMLSFCTTHFVSYFRSSESNAAVIKQKVLVRPSGFVTLSTVRCNIIECWTVCGGRDSAFGISAHYALDGLGFEPHPYRSRIPPSLLYSRYRLSFLVIKQPGRGVDHPPLSSAEAKEHADLYTYPHPTPYTFRHVI